MKYSFFSVRSLFNTLAIVILIVLFSFVLVNMTRDITYLEENEKRDRVTSFNLAMQRINSYLDLLRARVKVVAYQESDLLRSLLRNPENHDAEKRLHKIVKARLPDVFASSLAGASGDVVFDNFEGKVGESCKKNIQRFTRSGGEYRVQIHPNTEGYHFDIMVPFIDRIHGDRGTFFVSFRINTLVRILREASQEEHQLMVLFANRKSLIEIHTEGGRFYMKRPIRLTEEELARLDPVKAIPGSQWLLANLPPAQPLAKRLREVVLGHVGYLSLLLILTVLAILSIRREKQHRLQLQASHDHLEDLVTERTQELEQAHIQTNSLVENASDAIITIDEDQNIVLFNPAAEKMFQYKKEEMLGMPFSILLPDNVQDIHHKHVAEFGKDTTTRARMMDSRSTIQGKRKDGSLFSAEASICKSKIDGEYYFTAFVRDITDRQEAEAEIRRLALHDSLTDLANRHHFDFRFREAIAYHKRFPDQKICLLLLDLDHFKKVNDTYGHAAGDALLVHIADILRENVREVDTIGRLGGDEFAILLPGVEHNEQAESVAKKLIKALSEPHSIDGNTLEIGVSIGISFYPECATDPEELFKQADLMLYKSKEAGRNTYYVYTP